MGFLGDVGLAGVNAGLSLVGNKIAQQTSRENLDYMMSRYYSPQAQVIYKSLLIPNQTF